jgi:hypothetical protein
LFAATAGAGAAEDADEGGGNDDANGRRHKMRKGGKDREDRQNTFGYGTCPKGTSERVKHGQTLSKTLQCGNEFGGGMILKFFLYDLKVLSPPLSMFGTSFPFSIESIPNIANDGLAGGRKVEVACERL